MELKVPIRALELRDREGSFCLHKGTKPERVTAVQGTRMENSYQPRVTLQPPAWPFCSLFCRADSPAMMGSQSRHQIFASPEGLTPRSSEVKLSEHSMTWDLPGPCGVLATHCSCYLLASRDSCLGSASDRAHSLPAPLRIPEKSSGKSNLFRHHGSGELPEKGRS